jgi:hypothetical protein
MSEHQLNERTLNAIIVHEYRILWHHSGEKQYSRVLFVEAATPRDAREVAQRYIERKTGKSLPLIDECREAEPVPDGKVKE